MNESVALQKVRRDLLESAAKKLADDIVYDQDAGMINASLMRFADEIIATVMVKVEAAYRIGR
jgi:hypothetical protein